MSNDTQQRYAEERSIPQPLLTIRETAQYLHVSVRQVYLLIAAGSIPTVAVGSRLRVELEELRRALRGGDASESR